MSSLFIFLITLSILIILIYNKIDLGISLLICSGFVVALSGMPPIHALLTLWAGATNTITLELLGIISCILLMGGLMKHVGMLDKMVSSLDALFSDIRASLALIPAAIGMIPMPGGALFSAKISKDVGDRIDISPELKTFINYWFRHIWEYIFPLYPGLVLWVTLLDLEFKRIFFIHLPFTITAITVGIVMLVLKVRPKEMTLNQEPKVNRPKALIDLICAIWPLFVVVLSVLVLKLHILIPLLLCDLYLLFIKTKGWKQRWGIIRNDLSVHILFLIVTVMIFKEIISESSIITRLPIELSGMGIHPHVVVWVIPFLVGILTGIVHAYVGVSAPLMLPFVSGSSIDYTTLAFAFLSGFVGVLLSPVHLCLALSKEFFKAHWAGVYKLLIVPCLILLIMGIIRLIFFG